MKTTATNTGGSRAVLQDDSLQHDTEGDEDQQIEGGCLSREPLAADAREDDEGGVPSDGAEGLQAEAVERGRHWIFRRCTTNDRRRMSCVDLAQHQGHSKASVSSSLQRQQRRHR